MYVNKMTGEQVESPQIEVVWLDDVENIICTSPAKEEYETNPDDGDDFQ